MTARVTPAGLGRGEYARYCRALGLEADDTLWSPMARQTALPAWIGAPLIATAPARAKLATWARETPREAWTVQPDPAETLVALHAFGDELLVHTLARTLASLPPPICDYAVRRVTWLALGASVFGFAGARVPHDDRPWFVPFVFHMQDGDNWTRDLIGHEMAHTWLLEEPAPGETIRTAYWHQVVMQTPMSEVPAAARGRVGNVRAADVRAERECLALTRSWGFRDLGAQARFDE